MVDGVDASPPCCSPPAETTAHPSRNRYIRGSHDTPEPHCHAVDPHGRFKIDDVGWRLGRVESGPGARRLQ